MKPTANVLLTGFDPFGGETINPSWEAVRALDGEIVAGRTIRAVQLPTVFGRSLTVLRAALKRFRPDIVICVGQAGGRLGADDRNRLRFQDRAEHCHKSE